jgi:hypothetical protein
LKKINNSQKSSDKKTTLNNQTNSEKKDNLAENKDMKVSNEKETP